MNSIKSFGYTLVIISIIISQGIFAFGSEVPSAARFTSSDYGIEALKNGVRVPRSEIERNAEESGLTFEQSSDDYGQELMCQNPYSFAVQRFTHSNGSDYVTYRFITYASEKIQTDTIDAVNKKADEILVSLIKDGMTDYQKAKAIYKYVKNAAKYDSYSAKLITSEDWRKTADTWGYATSAYGCLINGKCVCEGYSKAFTILARKAGLYTAIVYGKTKKAEHQWNRVWCYDLNRNIYSVYDVDCCNGIFAGSYGKWKECSSYRYSDLASINSRISDDLSNRHVKYVFDLKGNNGKYIVN